MPSEQIPKTLKIAVVALGVIALCTIVLVYAKMQLSPDSAQTSGDAPVGTQEVTKEESTVGPTDVPTTLKGEVIPTRAEEPEMPSEDIQAKIKVVQGKVDAGEITIEEAQKEIYKLLGI